MAGSTPATKPAAVPKAGVKTPGVQIPFGNLKPEVELPASAEWVFAGDAVFVPDEPGLQRIDVKSNKSEKITAEVKNACGGMVSAFRSLWVPSCADSTLSRIDPKTSKVTATIPAKPANVPGAIAASSDSVWVLTSTERIARVDPDQNQVVAEVWVPPGCQGLAFGETALWLACPADGKILRINPATNVVEKRIEVSAQPDAIAVGEGSVWVLCKKDGKVDRIDPKTNKVTKSIELGIPGASGGISVAAGSVWVTAPGFPLTRIQVESEKVVQQFYGAGGGAIQATATAIWLVNTSEKKLLRIDPKRVVATLAE